MATAASLVTWQNINWRIRWCRWTSVQCALEAFTIFHTGCWDYIWLNFMVLWWMFVLLYYHVVYYFHWWISCVYYDMYFHFPSLATHMSYFVHCLSVWITHLSVCPSNIHTLLSKLPIIMQPMYSSNTFIHAWLCHSWFVKYKNFLCIYYVLEWWYCILKDKWNN